MNLFSNLLVINENEAIRGSTGSKLEGLGKEQGKNKAWPENPPGLDRGNRHISGCLVLRLGESPGSAGV